MAGRAVTPPVREFRRKGMHRLISAKWSETGTVLEEVTSDEKMLADAARLDAATNERIHGEVNGLAGVGPFELVYGIPNAHIVRAAFLHPGPFGARFNDATRGAWYAAESAHTSLAEVGYHRARRLSEMVVPEMPEERPDEEISEYDDWLSDFDASFHALEPPDQYADCLKPEPVPQCYAQGQALARQLLSEKSNGIVYPSVRRRGGTCVACFRPALVTRPRLGERYQIRLTAVFGARAEASGGYRREVRVVGR
jgi:RES domain-containing protein